MELEIRHGILQNAIVEQCRKKGIPYSLSFGVSCYIEINDSSWKEWLAPIFDDFLHTYDPLGWSYKRWGKLEERLKRLENHN